MSRGSQDKYVERDIPDFTESDGTGAEPVGLLDTTSGVLSAKDTRQYESQGVVVQVQSMGRKGHTYHGSLPGGLGGELLTGSLSYNTRKHISMRCGKCCASNRIN